MIGTSGTIITLVIGICAFNYFNDENMNGGPYSILVAVSTIHLPLVLTLTIKHHRKTRKVEPILPMTLQFHEENGDTPDETKETTLEIKEPTLEIKELTSEIKESTLEVKESTLEIRESRSLIKDLKLEREQHINNDSLKFEI